MMTVTSGSMTATISKLCRNSVPRHKNETKS